VATLLELRDARLEVPLVTRHVFEQELHTLIELALRLLFVAAPQLPMKRPNSIENVTHLSEWHALLSLPPDLETTIRGAGPPADPPRQYVGKGRASAWLKGYFVPDGARDRSRSPAR
jgi:hypothetical protein